uniref:uncharacterized protein LOC122582074 isoform X2 n=1 Tax=Erigeron canadensis TaxID=72917 RepID=UPI001CB912CE|nr:uncharacterized protein LOC122582074 isoform X2 [Erigeron canadensis]
MSLVDYDASSDEEEAQQPGRNNTNRGDVVISHKNDLSSNLPHPTTQKSTSFQVQQSDSTVKSSKPSTLKLPDASFLLGSPSLPSDASGSYDHTSRVAAAMAQNASRKRDPKELVPSHPRGKTARGNFPRSKTGPETTTGLLFPPQLSGRSNVVTEDINKLFAKRNGS